jgi:NTE family protein
MMPKISTKCTPTFILSISLFFLSLGVFAFDQDSLVIENLVFEGAGIRGIAYCGALMELEDRGYLSCIDRVAGTSSGAITASLIAIGYTPSETYEIVGSTDFGKFNDGGYGLAGGTVRLTRRLGFYRGNTFLKWFENLIEVKTGDPDLTFQDIVAARSNQEGCLYKELTIASTSLNHQRTIVFSVATYPDMRIADAVHASMAIPLYFEPVVIDEQGRVLPYRDMLPEHHMCVDGGFTANYLIGSFDVGETIAPTLGLRLDSDAQISQDMTDRQLAYQHIGSVSDFIGAFYYIMKETMNRQSLREVDWQRTVSISDCGMSPKVKKLSDGEKALLIEAGRTGVQRYMDH